MPEFLAQPPRPLQLGDPVAAFDCGVEELNRYLQRFAWANQQANAAVTYVAARHGAIAGYYTVVAASAEHEAAPERMKKGLARHPIPVLLLAHGAGSIEGGSIVVIVTISPDQQGALICINEQRKPTRVP